MLREDKQAQANAEAGLAPAPRWLTGLGHFPCGQCADGNSAIPVIGPAVGSIMMERTGGRSALIELNEAGQGCAGVADPRF